LFNQRLECVPAADRCDRRRQTCFVVPCGQNSCTDAGEGFQHITDGADTLARLLVSLAFGSSVELADNSVMGLDDRVGDHRPPLNRAYGEDGQLPVLGQITEPVGIVAFALAPKPADMV
jgi:hypothetical protein